MESNIHIQTEREWSIMLLLFTCLRVNIWFDTKHNSITAFKQATFHSLERTWNDTLLLLLTSTSGLKTSPLIIFIMHFFHPSFTRGTFSFPSPSRSFGSHHIMWAVPPKSPTPHNSRSLLTTCQGRQFSSKWIEPYCNMPNYSGLIVHELMNFAKSLDWISHIFQFDFGNTSYNPIPQLLFTPQKLCW